MWQTLHTRKCCDPWQATGLQFLERSNFQLASPLRSRRRTQTAGLKYLLQLRDSTQVCKGDARSARATLRHLR